MADIPPPFFIWNIIVYQTTYAIIVDDLSVNVHSSLLVVHLIHSRNKNGEIFRWEILHDTTEQLGR